MSDTKKHDKVLGELAERLAFSPDVVCGKRNEGAIAAERILRAKLLPVLAEQWEEAAKHLETTYSGSSIAAVVKSLRAEAHRRGLGVEKGEGDGKDEASRS